MEFLGEFNFLVVYRPGKENLASNFLSHWEIVFPSLQGDFVAKNPGNIQQLFEIKEDKSLKLATMTITFLKDQLKSIAADQLSDLILADLIAAVSCGLVKKIIPLIVILSPRDPYTGGHKCARDVEVSHNR